MKKHFFSILISVAMLLGAYHGSIHLGGLVPKDAVIATITAITAATIITFISTTSITFPPFGVLFFIIIFTSGIIGTIFATTPVVVATTIIIPFIALLIVLFGNGFPEKGEKQEGIHIGNVLGASLLEALVIFIAFYPYTT